MRVQITIFKCTRAKIENFKNFKGLQLSFYDSFNT